MAQKNSTTVRILQNHKTTVISPTLLVVIGFLAGIIVSVVGFMVFLKISNANRNEIVSADAATFNEEAIKHPINEEQSMNHLLEQHEIPDDEAIQQPKDSELSKLFKHRSVAIAAIPRISSFETTIQPPVADKTNTADKLTTNSKSREPKQTTTTHPEPATTENLHASVEITVTQKPFKVQ